ncbi:unnamed protein product [Penicillium salamii]|uniref:Uncharacterized protein n=1 Tax=Penicillium salamii TaxID=1612424 RepID=A0A9W4IG86_9EURO|nr:unnamed protein product [Penicillium salamii]
MNFVESVIKGSLQSGAMPKAFPLISGSNGAKPSTPNDRIMQAFGSIYNPYPLLATNALINGAKGKLIGLKLPWSEKKIENLAKVAIKADTNEAIQKVLIIIQSVFGIFEYFADYRWVVRAIRIVVGVYAFARADGRTLKTNDAVAAVLSEFESKIQKISMLKITATETTIFNLDSLN